MQILQGLYNEYLGTLKPSKRYVSPPAEFLRVVPDVIAIVESPDNVNVAAKDFEHITSRFEQVVAEYIARQRDHCAAIMKKTLEQYTGGDAKYPSDMFTRKDLHPVDLVESIWHHRYGWDWRLPRIVGWHSLTSHLYESMNPSYEIRPGVLVCAPGNPIFDYHTAQFASSLVSLVGALPYTISAAQMDKRDDRFTCNCLMENGRMIFTWRSAVSPILPSHAFQCSLSCIDCTQPLVGCCQQ